MYTGPYRVVEKLSPILYRIQRSPRAQSMVVYVDKLKLVEGPIVNETETPERTSEVPDVSDDEDESPKLQRPRRNIQKPSRYR